MRNAAPGFSNSAIIAWNNGLIASAPLSGPSDVNSTAPGAQSDRMPLRSPSPKHFKWSRTSFAGISPLTVDRLSI
jgi:hypothetical protein